MFVKKNLNVLYLISSQFDTAQTLRNLALTFNARCYIYINRLIIYRDSVNGSKYILEINQKT